MITLIPVLVLVQGTISTCIYCKFKKKKNIQDLLFEAQNCFELKFGSDLRQVDGFSLGTSVSFTIKLAATIQGLKLV